MNISKDFTLMVYAPDIDRRGKQILENFFGKNVHYVDSLEGITSLKWVKPPIFLIRDVEENLEIIDYGVPFIQQVLDKLEGSEKGIFWPWSLDNEGQREEWSSQIKDFKGWYIGEGGTDLGELQRVCEDFLDKGIDKKENSDSEINIIS